MGKKVLEEDSHKINLAPFHHAINSWGETHYQYFPWRETKSPDKILIAEIMLHRTQARQVLPVYEKFIFNYPELRNLSGVSRNELHEMLYSLGLPQRIDMLYEMLKDLSDRFNGEVPKDKVELISLPGVSNYIASAVRCFAWEFPDAIIDTNTVRVVGRMFGLEIKDSLRRNKRFKKIIENLVDTHSPKSYNYALIDLAHMICTVRTPACKKCPILEFCVYGNIEV